MDLKELLENIKDYVNKEITLQGWIRSHRKQKEFGFIDFSDGTCFKHMQLVYDNTLAEFDTIQKYLVGCAITVTGTQMQDDNSVPTASYNGPISDISF